MAQPDVGERHARDILCESHAFARRHILAVRGGGREMLCDELYGFQFKHIRKFPRALGDVALDGVGECVHACRGGEAFGHGRHEFGVYDGEGGDVVGVDAHHLSARFLVDDDVVDGDFRGGARRRRQSYDGYALTCRRRRAFEGDDVRELGVVGDDGDALCRVDGGAAAYRDDEVRAGEIESLHARFDVLHGGVGFEVRESLVGDAFEFCGDHVGNAEFHEVFVHDHEGFFEAAATDLAAELLPRACAEIGCFVE